MSEEPAKYYPMQVLEDGQDFDGLEYTEVRIARVKRLIESSKRKLVEYYTDLAELEAKKAALLAQQNIHNANTQQE